MKVKAAAALAIVAGLVTVVAPQVAGAAQPSGCGSPYGTTAVACVIPHATGARAEQAVMSKLSPALQRRIKAIQKMTPAQRAGLVLY